MFNYKLFAERLTQALTEKDISQAELSRRIITARGTVSRWMHGVSAPHAEDLYKMCEELNVSADWLLGLSDRKER